MVKFADLVRQNAPQLTWLEAVLVGKDHRIGNFGMNEVAELFICRSSRSQAQTHLRRDG